MVRSRLTVPPTATPPGADHRLHGAVGDVGEDRVPGAHVADGGADERGGEGKSRRLRERETRGEDRRNRADEDEEGSDGDEEIGTRREWDEEVRDGCRVGRGGNRAGGVVRT